MWAEGRNRSDRGCSKFTKPPSPPHHSLAILFPPGRLGQGHSLLVPLPQPFLKPLHSLYFVQTRVVNDITRYIIIDFFFSLFVLLPLGILGGLFVREIPGTSSAGDLVGRCGGQDTLCEAAYRKHKHTCFPSLSIPEKSPDKSLSVFLATWRPAMLAKQMYAPQRGPRGARRMLEGTEFHR